MSIGCPFDNFKDMVFPRCFTCSGVLKQIIANDSCMKQVQSHLSIFKSWDTSRRNRCQSKRLNTRSGMAGLLCQLQSNWFIYVDKWFHFKQSLQKCMLVNVMCVENLICCIIFSLIAFPWYPVTWGITMCRNSNCN